MRINGKNRLACKTLVKDLNTKKPITVETDQGPDRREGPDRRHGNRSWRPIAR